MTFQGSKVKYAKYIIPFIEKTLKDKNIDTFIDCCVGGANIIKDVKAKHKIGIDKDKYLIAFYKHVQENGFEIIDPEPSKEEWDRAKGYDKNISDWKIGFISVFCSFGTRGFGGGYINNDRYFSRQRTFLKDIEKIKDIDFIAEDYHYLSNFTNTVIYIDPPYINTKKYNFGKDFDYEDFWNFVRELSKTNYVFVSEQVAPDDALIIWEKDTSRTVKGKRYPAVERLYTFNKELKF